MTVHVVPDRDADDRQPICRPTRATPAIIDPLTNAIGFWNWMLDNGYESGVEDRTTHAS